MLFHNVAHGCIIGDHEVLTCKEATILARGVASDKNGRIVAVVGLDRFELEIGDVDETSGLVVCRLNHGDDSDRRRHDELLRSHGLEPSEKMISAAVKLSVSLGMGQEVGFLHTGEAENVLRALGSYAKQQFDVSVVSHFRRPQDGALKSFVTGVLPGRVLHAGAPMFTRDGTLVGILSECENYKSDAGRRAVGRTLLGHPRFMTNIAGKPSSGDS